MAREHQTRKAYRSDLTDAQWARLGTLIPAARHNRGGRPRAIDLREVLNTLLYLTRTGCYWAMLPHDLLPKSSVYDYFAQWRDDGTWTNLVAALREALPNNPQLWRQFERLQRVLETKVHT